MKINTELLAAMIAAYLRSLNCEANAENVFQVTSDLFNIKSIVLK